MEGFMRLWKLTDRKHRTRGATQWGEGATHTASGEGELCTPGWLHAYLSPELAVLLNPIHADISDPVLWECEGDIGKRDHDLKVGCSRLTTLRAVPLPACSVEQRVEFAIRCALAVCDEPSFVAWANAWLDGSNRSAAAAEAATEAAPEAAAAKEAAAKEAAAWAAWAAEAAEAAWAAAAAARAAEAAAAAARAARAETARAETARAETARAEMAKPLDLVALARRVLSGAEA
jgi:hypothetical protein